MDLLGDRRGQSIQIGAIILFGALIILLSTYQAFVVPDQNREVEFKHSQTVQNDLKDVRGAIISASDGQRSSVSVQLGTEYPARAIFLNPGPPSGSLRTVGTTDANINATIENAAASGDAGDFWDGTPRNYTTGDLIYTPNYNEYQNAPETVYSNTLLSNRFESDNLTITDQSLVDGKTITLVALNGSLSRGQSGSVSVDVRPMSTSSTTVPIENTAGKNVRLELPTTLDNDTWEQVLDDQEYVVSHEVGSPGNGPLNQLNLTLQQGEMYTLKLARVGVGNRVGETPRSSYLVKTRGNGETVQEGGQVSLGIEARDKFNNPVSGESINTSVSDGTIVSAKSDNETGGSGAATLVYEAPSAVSGSSEERINVSLATVADDSSQPEEVSFSVTVRNSSGSSDSSSAYNTDWRSPDSEPGTESCDSTACTLNYNDADALNLTMETDPVADGAPVDYAVGNQDIGSVAPIEATTNANGRNTTTFTPCNNGEVNVYTSSGGDGDVIELNVTNYGSLTIDPDTGGSNSTHVWRFDDVCFDGEVDTITANYSSSDASFDGLDQGNITVKIDKNGNGTSTPVSVNNDVYSGSTATFDLDGSFDIDGVVNVTIEDIENPPAGDYSASLTFNGSQDSVTFDKDFTTVTPSPQGTVDVENSITADQNDFTVDYTFGFTQDDNATVVIENEDTGGSRTETVTSDGQLTISDTDVGGLNDGDTIRGTIYETNNQTTQLDTDATTVSLPPNFRVNITSTNSPVTEGDDLLVNATVENTGDTGGTQDITLDVGGTERNSTQLTIAAGGTETVNLTWTTGGGDAGDYTATIASDNDTASQQVRVDESGQTLQAVESQGVSTNSGNELRFRVENTKQSSITIQNFSMDTSLGGQDSINNGGNNELRIGNGFANRDASGNSPGGRFTADGTVYDLVSDSNNGGQYATLTSGEVNEVRFRGVNVNLGNLEFANSAAEADVTVTLGLGDGSVQTFYFRQP